MMKKHKIIYWTSTGLIAAFMLFSGIPNILLTPESVDFLNAKLGFPVYLIPFLGVAKALGSIAILIPGLTRIKEWAYAGLAFDLLGAAYSVTAATGFNAGFFIFIGLSLAVLFTSYIYHHKLLNPQHA